MSESSAQKITVRSRLDFAGFCLDVDLEEPLDGIVGLFGPSGSGKSTLLRVIAGLENQATGVVGINGERWQDSGKQTFVAPHLRPVGYVFQHARLFPHLTVAGNLEFAHRRGSKAGDNSAQDEVISAMHLQSLLPRAVDALSGGEIQRVALARTLLSAPRLLLLDEPLAALDHDAKNEILPYLEALPGRFGIPAIFVSHAVNEMARLAGRVIALDDGKVAAVGSAASILSGDALRAAALPFEPVTILQVTVSEHLPALHLTRVKFGKQQITVPALPGTAPGDAARLAVRAGDIILATDRPKNLSVRNTLAGTVNDITGMADSAFAMVSVAVDGVTFKAQVTHQAVSELGLATGSDVYALIKTATFDRGL